MPKFFKWTIILFKSYKRYLQILSGKMVADKTHEYMGLDGAQTTKNGPFSPIESFRKSL